jgi:hypothetical protein
LHCPFEISLLVPVDLVARGQQKTPCLKGAILALSSRTAALLSARHWTLDAAYGGVRRNI